MRSRASTQILDGDGSVAPGFMHNICHTARMSPSVMSGGSTRAATLPSMGNSFV